MNHLRGRANDMTNNLEIAKRIIKKNILTRHVVVFLIAEIGAVTRLELCTKKTDLQ